MGTILKNCVLTLLVVIVQSQAAQAGAVQNQDKLLFSQTETALLEELDNARGREGVDIFTLNNMNVRATLSDNVANHNVNGYNIIDHGSFAQTSGITDVVQNSGNNVIIQNSTMVNVTIAP
ncbi:hypothetical protein [Methylobacter sp.]|uniref:hypothetical protein n=1 Tax=Methylobacter sp. TaxID=2051955 RepID=UPI002487A3AD|nr:hypothetical protein [Methylobacter sp.]MDI1276459.1 hypothetical protein [Methylobacter sp.]MDI1359354.1 hypothetical protein [Methylobacter sp.]